MQSSTYTAQPLCSFMFILSTYMLSINNLEPKERLHLWVHVLVHGTNYMKVELVAQRSAPIRPQGFGSTTWHWPCPILRPSHHLIIYPSRQWFNPLGSKPHWALPSAIGSYPPDSTFVIGLCLLPLGSIFHHWVPPLVIRLCLPSLGSTPRRRALPSAIGLYPLSLGLVVVAFDTPVWWSVIVDPIVVDPSSWCGQ